MKLMDCPEKKCDIHAVVKEDKRHIQAIGKKDKGKQVSTQRYIKGIRVNNPKTKLVYRAVVKPQSDNHVKSNMEQSLDATKKSPSPDSLKNGVSTYINDNILRNFVDKTVKEESVIRNNDTDGYEAFLPNDGTSLPSSSFGGGKLLEDEILNDYDDYEDQFEEYSSSYREFCDQFDFKVKSRGRK
ncbi:hypothetical protein Tco_1398973 [Tanacetum coccineum]